MERIFAGPRNPVDEQAHAQSSLRHFCHFTILDLDLEGHVHWKKKHGVMGSCIGSKIMFDIEKSVHCAQTRSCTLLYPIVTWRARILPLWTTLSSACQLPLGFLLKRLNLILSHIKHAFGIFCCKILLHIIAPIRSGFVPTYRIWAQAPWMNTVSSQFVIGVNNEQGHISCMFPKSLATCNWSVFQGYLSYKAHSFSKLGPGTKVPAPTLHLPGRLTKSLWEGALGKLHEVDKWKTIS